MSITFTQLCDPTTIFDRAHLMPRPGRRRPRSSRPNLTLTQSDGLWSLHPDLPPTPVWMYEHSLPGPVIEVETGDAVEVRHRNRIATTLPYPLVVVDGVGRMNEPGDTGAVLSGPDAQASTNAAALQARTVVHLHGAPSAPEGDGWPEYVISPGEDRDADYEFPRETWTATNHDGVSTTYRSGVAPMYWYHDHGMGVTRLNVYAGLAGIWLVRHPLEHVLGLPTNTKDEIPLILMDRNLETTDGDPASPMTGRMLHKVETGVRECFPPVNLVNGLAWPRCEVRPRVTRLRLLNGSNARTYRLHFLAMRNAADPSPVPVPADLVQQIGTDAGLLGQAVSLPVDGLVLSPGERADVLVDFGALRQNGFSHVAVYNNAPAPFGGLAPGAADAVTGSDPDGYRVVPHVMRFDIRDGCGVSGLRGKAIAGMPLDPDFVRLTHTQLGEHTHATVALREEVDVVYDDLGHPIGNRTMLYLHELLPESQANHLGLNLRKVDVSTYNETGGILGTRPSGVRLVIPGEPEAFVSIGKRFTDATTVSIPQGGWHIWRVINLSPDTHPFHVHLVSFQATSRVRLAVDPTAFPGGVASDAADYTFVARTDVGLDANEQGWKDTLRVNPGVRNPADDAVIEAEMVSVAGCYARHSGRYVYHCHILEHEDIEMMRSFSVLPEDLMTVMGHNHHHH